MAKTTDKSPSTSTEPTQPTATQRLREWESVQREAEAEHWRERQRIEAEVEANQADETSPGGRYIDASGRLVDCNGVELLDPSEAEREQMQQAAERFAAFRANGGRSLP